MSDHGRERITIIAIDQPLCVHQYGDGLASPTPMAGSPLAAFGCRAAMSAENPRKCYNTRATCQDEDNYTPESLTLLFSKPHQDLVRYYGYVLPCLVSHQITPGFVNLAGMYDSSSPLGQREVLTIQMSDFKHSDLLVDKYRLERESGAAAFGSPLSTFVPYDRGTFWGKWKARNPYTGYAVRLYDGFLGDAIEDMTVRSYILDRIDGPDDGGSVRIIAKDQLSRVEAKKAVAPRASRGELAGNITSGASSAALSPTGIGDEDYPNMAGSPSQFYVAINNEIIKCSRASGSDTLQLIQRGCFGTTAAAHQDEDLVQWVLCFEAELGHEIVRSLLVDYGGVDASLIDDAEWDSQASEITEVYTARIADPVPVNELVGEILVQAGFTIWHDPASGLINLRALRPVASMATVDDDTWIKAGSMDPKVLEDKRISQVWIYYGQKSPLEALDETRNYYSRLVAIDPTAEEAEQYGTAKVKRIFSRWIPQFGRSTALEAAERLLSIFRDPPIQATFDIYAGRDGELALARFITLQTDRIQDETGATEENTQYAVVSLERAFDNIRVVAQEVSFATLPDTVGSGGSDDPRAIFIENNTTSINLRSIHDSLYEAPPAGSSPPLVVTFTIESGIYVYSTSTGSGAIDTGSWPASVDLRLDNNGYIMAKGGNGGSGAAGGSGGNAIELGHSITINNTNGYILGGGGGGGGALNILGAGDVAGGGGGAGGGDGGATTGFSGGAGGAIGAAGSDGGGLSDGGGGAHAGGGGGRIAVGSGGAGAVIRAIGAGSAGTPGRGAACGGGGGAVGDDGTDADGGAGGSNTAAGSNGTTSGGSNVAAAGGGGGWGEAGGSAQNDSGLAFAGGAAGKAINLNGYSVTWSGGSASPQVRGAVS